MSFQNRILDALPTPLLERLQPCLQALRLPVGQVLFATNDKVSRIFFPESGAISLVSELATGEMMNPQWSGGTA